MITQKEILLYQKESLLLKIRKYIMSATRELLKDAGDRFNQCIQIFQKKGDNVNRLKHYNKDLNLYKKGR